MFLCLCCIQLPKKCHWSDIYSILNCSTFSLSLLPADDMDSLQVEMSGLLKELHCPSEELVSGILKGRLLKAKDHLKCLCMSSLLNSCGFSFSPFLCPYQLNSNFFSPIQCSSAPSSRQPRLPSVGASQTHKTAVQATRSSWRCAPH